MRFALVALGLAFGVLACGGPPPGEVYREAPETNPAKREEQREFAAAAHREAHAQLVADAIKPLKLADPIAAAQFELGSLGVGPISVVDQRALVAAVDPVRSSAGEIDESQLEPAEVVVIRTLRFALERIHDEVQRRPQARVDPLFAVRAVERATDEIEWRRIQGECGEACDAALRGLDDTLTSAQQQLAASSLASAREAAARARALASRLRGLAFADAGAALDAYAALLDPMIASLPEAEVIGWPNSSAELQGAGVRRLPDAMGERALTRLLSVEERIDAPVSELWSLTKQHAARWQRMRAELVGPELPEDPRTPVDVERCNAARERIAGTLGVIPDVDPPQLDCVKWLAFRGETSMSEGELVIALLDVGWIEPQRRRVRREELPAIGLVAGQWSGEVHRHLRRVMLSALLNEPHARALALDQGRAALCLAGAALWIHGGLGPSDELGLMLGPDCALLGDAKDVEARVLADPRGALAGLGLSLIGDEPAAMAGFDRFWWAPLGLMRLLATPAGVHPDRFGLPSDARAPQEPEIEVEFEQLTPSPAP
jgi:hypothetical protein